MPAVPRVPTLNASDPQWMRSLKAWCADVVACCRAARVSGDGKTIAVRQGVVSVLMPPRYQMLEVYDVGDATFKVRAAGLGTNNGWPDPDTIGGIRIRGAHYDLAAGTGFTDNTSGDGHYLAAAISASSWVWIDANRKDLTATLQIGTARPATDATGYTEQYPIAYMHWDGDRIDGWVPLHSTPVLPGMA